MERDEINRTTEKHNDTAASTDKLTADLAFSNEKEQGAHNEPIVERKETKTMIKLGVFFGERKRTNFFSRGDTLFEVVTYTQSLTSRRYKSKTLRKQ